MEKMNSLSLNEDYIPIGLKKYKYFIYMNILENINIKDNISIEKYTKLLQEYSKIKKHNSILKKAIIEVNN